MRLLTIHKLLLATLLLATTAPAQLQPLLNAGPPLLLRLEGVLQPTRVAAAGTGFAVVSMGFLGNDDGERYLGVDDARTTGGDQPLDGKDVLAALAPLQPNLLVAGPAALTGTLRRLPPGTRVRMEGLVDRGSRTYYLRDVSRASD